MHLNETTIFYEWKHFKKAHRFPKRVYHMEKPVGTNVILIHSIEAKGNKMEGEFVSVVDWF